MSRLALSLSVFTRFGLLPWAGYPVASGVPERRTPWWGPERAFLGAWLRQGDRPAQILRFPLLESGETRSRFVAGARMARR